MTSHPFRFLLPAVFGVVVAPIGSAQLKAPREQVLQIANRKDFAKTREALVKQALIEAGKTTIRRPSNYEELISAPQDFMKYDEKPAHQERLTDEEWHRFALSLADANINGELSTRLPRMAASYTFTKDEKILTATLNQLTEMAKWFPLERPGSVSPKQNISPAPWLGTGWGIRAIIDTIELLPKDKVSTELHDQFHANFEKEITEIREAWKANQLWYTREKSAYSNQWVVPMEGLVRASIFNGIDQHRDDYEFGVANLLKSLDAQGPNGEFVEGCSYAGITMNALLSAAEATSRIGDQRLIQHPYFLKFPVWYAHHLQPGGEMINAFDSKIAVLDPALLSRFVAVVKSPEALWALTRGRKPDYGNTLWGLLGRANATFPAKEPPLFAAYDFAARINWRDSWNDETAAGFWMRGGHETDAHDHMDRGHISFNIGKRPILIESGLSSYGIPQHPTHYKSVAGHNVLQIGPEKPTELTPKILKTASQILDPAHRSAPITVERMDATGGSATVDLSGCYAETKRWIRHVSWDREGVSVRDEVELKNPNVVQFRWHLGAPDDSEKRIEKGHVNVAGIDVKFSSNAEVSAEVESMPGFDSLIKKDRNHACVVIRSTAPVSSMTLNSEIMVTK